jgi:hypothetical protein
MLLPGDIDIAEAVPEIPTAMKVGSCNRRENTRMSTGRGKRLRSRQQVRWGRPRGGNPGAAGRRFEVHPNPSAHLRRSAVGRVTEILINRGSKV